MSGFRVMIDGTPADAEALRAVLTDGDQTAEVQIARVGRELIVVVAGLYGSTINDRGHLLVSVATTPGSSSGPEPPEG